MKNNGMRIKHPKLRGEWAELCFMTRAAEHGLCVTKPWGETARYDFAVEHEGRFVRVQVKSTMFVDRGGYSCSVRGCRGPYQGDAFDFLAVYLIPEDLWYIIPAKKVKGQGSVALYPKLKKSKYGRYREAWRLLRKNRRHGTAGTERVLESIEACAETSSSQWAVLSSQLYPG
jgi:PD-(D/E)XK endonuclease